MASLLARVPAGRLRQLAAPSAAGVRRAVASKAPAASWSGVPAAARPIPLGALPCWARQRRGTAAIMPPLRASAQASPPATVESAAAKVDAEAEGRGGGAVVLLDVEGMKCGGCSAAVKRILAAQPGVRGASVNLLTKIAALQVDADTPDPESLARSAAEAVSAKGFATTLRDAGKPIEFGSEDGKDEDEVLRARLELGLAWFLVAACCTHHVGHMLHAAGMHEYAHGPLMTAMGSTPVTASIGALALLGPGRRCEGP
eukprot:jgi/Tetstr1/442309/TSEL_030450.t1